MRKHLLGVLFLFIFSLWSLRSIFHPGFMYSHDSFWHVERLMNLSSLIPLQFPVRWSPTLDNGFGLPLFNFTYPAPYYLGAVLMSLGIGPVKTYYFLLFFSYLIGGIGVYFLGRKNRLIGIFAALLYLLTPYQYLDIFVRGALGEVVALGIIPWIFLSYEDMSKTGKLKWFSSLPLALLILSHNFYAYLFIGLLAIFFFTIYEHKWLLIKSFILSLLLSAFFIFPALFEKSSLLITQSDSFSYQAHFVYPSQLFYSKWVYLGSVPGNDQNEMSYQLGIANIIIIIVGLILAASQLIFNRKKSKLPIISLAILLSIFMMLSPSTWFWDHIPLMSTLQFPWRFLGVITILIPLLYLEISAKLDGQRQFWFKLFSLVLIFIGLLNTRNYFRPVKWLTGEEFLTMHYNYAGQNTTASRNELVPRWAPKERDLPVGSDLVLGPGAEIVSRQESPYSLTFKAHSLNSDISAVYYRNYYPSWHGYVDHRPIKLSPTSTGEIKFPLLEGEHEYLIQIESTPLEKISNIGTIIGLIIVFIQIYWDRRHVEA